MTIIYILIPIAIIFTAVAIYLFFWAVKTEQFDDLEKQGMSILFDDDKTQSTAQTKTRQSNKVQTKKTQKQKTTIEQQTDIKTDDSDVRN